MSGALALGDLCIEECLREAISGRDVPFDCWTEAKAYASVTRQLRAWFGDPQVIASTGLANGGELPQALQALDFDLRASLVLSLLEGFAPPQIGAILQCTPDEVRRRIDEAQRLLDQKRGVTVLIVEDNVLTARTLTDAVTGFGHKVVGVARDGDDAVRIAKSAEPRLVLADVKLLNGGSGVAAARRIRDAVAAQVIVVTGHPEMLDRGDRSAFPVVAKPIALEMLQQTISQVLAA